MRPSSSRRAQRWHARADGLTGILIHGMVVFSPWAFGTTQPWAKWVMNLCGFALGLLLLGKRWLRRQGGQFPQRWGTEAGGPSAVGGEWLTRGLGIVTVVVLGYCLVSALNARAWVIPETLEFQYRESIAWLPHSYDRAASWQIFWQSLALAFSFWAIRDWLLIPSGSDLEATGANANGAARLPFRVRSLLWVLCLNGALLALEGLVQRAMGTNRLLGFMPTRLNPFADAQFGPYAYRSNAAQYFLLLWPVALGFWWALRRGAKAGVTGTKFHNYLLPCVLLLIIAPLASLSRGAALIGGASCLAGIGLLLLLGGRRSQWKRALGVAVLVGAGGWLGTGMDWELLTRWFAAGTIDASRLEIWRNTWAIFLEHPLYGTGPGSFSNVYYLYRPNPADSWPAYAHNDWLETLATFGAVGSSFILAALALALARPVRRGGFRVPRLFLALIYLGLANVLAFAFVDFPFVIYSILFLFLVIVALLTCCAARRPG